MSAREPYCQIEAFIDPDQFDRIEDGMPRQLVTVVMVDDTMQEYSPATSALTAWQARELAFVLLVCAEHADQRTRCGEAGR